MTFKVVDLFAGAGGLSQGFLMVNGISSEPAFEIVKAVEIDAMACESLRHHLGTQRIDAGNVVINGDIEDREVKENIINSCKGVDIVIGGPPCQTYSLVGPARSGSDKLREKLANDSRNTLYQHYIEIVMGLKPHFILFENVEGIISKQLEAGTGKSKRILEVIIQDLKDLGYDTTVDSGGVKKDYLFLNAVDYGVPQSRSRVFIIANRLGLPNPAPKIIYGPFTGKPYQTLKSTISELPAVIPPINTTVFKNLKNLELIIKKPDEYLAYFVKSIGALRTKFKGREGEKEYNNLVDVVKKNYKLVVNNKGIKALRRFVEDYNDNLAGLNGIIYEQNNYPALHICRPHNIRDVCIFSRMKQGTTSAQFLNKSNAHYDGSLAAIYPYNTDIHKDTYVRQSWSLPSTTILSHMNRDGLRFIHPGQPRSFTPCEAALLQSFNDESKFYHTQSDMFVQIGNAVPPLLARAIGEVIYSSLNRYWSKKMRNP